MLSLSITCPSLSGLSCNISTISQENTHFWELLASTRNSNAWLIAGVQNELSLQEIPSEQMEERRGPLMSLSISANILCCPSRKNFNILMNCLSMDAGLATDIFASFSLWISVWNLQSQTFCCPQSQWNWFQTGFHDILLTSDDFARFSLCWVCWWSPCTVQPQMGTH